MNEEMADDARKVALGYVDAINRGDERGRVSELAIYYGNENLAKG